MSRLALHLLGPPCLERDGVPLEFERRKNIALIAYLAVTGETHSRESLITLLWPEVEPSRARANLRRNLSVLKKTLGGEWLVVDWETVGLDPSADVWADVDQFHRLLQVCEGHDHPEGDVCPECLAALAEAVELYRGDFLAGLSLRDSASFDEFQFFQTEGLRQELAAALERLARGHSHRGEYEQAIPYARRWLALDPLHEPAHRCLMQLYAQAGQRAAALRQYEDCVRILNEELDLPPAEETTSLYEQIRTGLPDREEPPFRAPWPRHNLPAQATPFIGREKVLAEIKERLEDPTCRLLTLVGPGGVGKTRLALEAAAAQLDHYTHGVYFVSLAPLQSVEAIVPTVAEALGCRFYEEDEPQQQVLNYLRQKSLLLILDSFEHLLACPEPSRRDSVGLVTDVLETAPDVKILTTSRARLNVQGEHLFPIAGMDCPESPPEAVTDATYYSAVKLFLQSARWVQPDFDLTADNLTDVVRICHLVEGMPLGIVLAAPWVGMLSPQEIAVEISRSLDLLETDLRDTPERQRSMRAAFDHSWNLLTARERAVMQALSVFRGGFARDAAQYVTGSSLRELRALADKSLLHRTATSRYEMHELLRQYVTEELDESPATSRAARDRHCAYYTTALQGWGEDLKGLRQQTALAGMDVEIENARAAWSWAVERGQVEQLDQALDGLCRFYEWRRRYQEGEAACRIAADKLEATGSGDGPVLSGVEGLRAPCPEAKGLRVWARILTWQSVFSGVLGRTELAGQLLEQSLALLEGPELADQDTRPERAFVLLRMGNMAGHSDFEEARRLYEQSLALYQALGDRWHTANVLFALGRVAKDWEETGRLFEQSLTLYQALGDREGTASALDGLAQVASLSVGAIDEAKRLLEEGLAIRREVGDQRGIALSLRHLGYNAVSQGQLEQGVRLISEGSAILQEMGDRASVAEGLTVLGIMLVNLGKFAEAHSRIEQGLAIWSDLGVPHLEVYWNIQLGFTKMHLGRYEQARVQGQMSLSLARQIGSRPESSRPESGLAYRFDEPNIGFALRLLGEAALALEEYAEAQQLVEESVAVYRENRELTGVWQWAFTALGVAARGLGQLQQAGQHFYDALRDAAAGDYRVWALPGIALLLADRDEVERAVELYALASRDQLVANSRWFEDVFGRHIAAAARLPPDLVAAAQERGRARDLEATVAELLAELGQKQRS